MEKVKVRVLDFKPIKEGEAEYELEDGARIVIKTRLESVSNRLDNQNNPERDEMGNIRYDLELGSVVRVIPKDRIKYVRIPKPPEVKR